LRLAAQRCIKPPVIIPVEGCEDERVVIEVDIVPTAAVCQRNIFYSKKKGEKEKHIFVRQDTENRPFGEGANSQLSNLVWENAKLREQEEQYFILSQFKPI
jgi:hypothetical protein